MEFEYDSEKSKTNKAKHGIDFEETQKIWESDHLEIAAKSEAETRFIVIGKILEKLWSAVITYREAIIRLISVRRARKKEEEMYEDAKSKDDLYKGIR